MKEGRAELKQKSPPSWERRRVPVFEREVVEVRGVEPSDATSQDASLRGERDDWRGLNMSELAQNLLGIVGRPTPSAVRYPNPRFSLQSASPARIQKTLPRQFGKFHDQRKIGNT